MENVIILLSLYNMKFFKKFSEVYREFVLSIIGCIFLNNVIVVEIL